MSIQGIVCKIPSKSSSVRIGGILSLVLVVGVLLGGIWPERLQAAAEALGFIAVYRDGSSLGGAISVAVSPDSQHVYVAGQDDDAVAVFSRNDSSGELSFIERQKDGVNGVEGLNGAVSVTVSPDNNHVYVAGEYDNAIAVFSRNSTTGRLTFVEVQEDDVGGVDGLDSPNSVAVSPDNKHVYVASEDEDAVAIFSRDTSTGRLTFVEIQQDGIGGVDGLAWASSVTVSPDNQHVYVTSDFGDNSVAAFSRNSTTGKLTFVEVEKDGLGGVDGLDGARSVVVSPDNNHVYVASDDDDAVAVFSRNSSTGELTFVEVQKDGSGGVDGLAWASSVTVSPDDKHVYVTSEFVDDSVAVFSRNSTTGELTFVEVQKDGSGGVDGLAGASSVAVSPDNNHVYVASEDDGAVAAFSRNSSTGALSFVEQIQEALANGIEGLNGAKGVAISPDDQHIYVAGEGDDAVAVFSRDSSSGELTFVEVYQDGMGGVDGLDDANAVAVSPDNNHVYVTSDFDDALVVFGRDTSTGKLTFIEKHEDGVGGVDGLGGAISVAVSPDNKHVYVASESFDNAVAVFSRNTGTGQLTFVEAQKDGDVGFDGLYGANSVTVSPDNNHVYVASYQDDAVVVFSRNTSTGQLTFVEARQDGVGGVEGLEGARSVVVSPDNNHVYVAGSLDHALAVFSRNSSTGQLTFVEVQQESVGGIDGLLGADAVLVSPDNNYVYVAGRIDDAVSVFNRNSSTGQLTYLKKQEDGEGGVDGLNGASALAVSSGNEHLYVAAETDDTVAVFGSTSTSIYLPSIVKQVQPGQ